MFHRSQLLATMTKVLLGYLSDKRILAYFKSRLQKLINAFVVETGSEWVDKDFFVAALILLYNADFTSGMEHRFDQVSDMPKLMRVLPEKYTQAQVLASMQKCESLLQLFDVPDDFSQVPDGLETMLTALFFLVPRMAPL